MCCNVLILEVKIVFGDTSSLLKCSLLEYPVQSSSTVIHIHVQRQTAYPLYKHICVQTCYMYT